LRIHPHASAERHLAPQILQDLLIHRHLQQPHRVESGGEAGLLLERGVEVPGVLRDLHCRARGESRRHDQPGRVPSRTGGQPVSLEQDHIATAALGQVVRDAATDHAATDDDHGT